MDTGEKRQLHGGKGKWRWGRDRGVDGGNVACETVGIRKQETAGRGGQSASVGVLVKKKNTPHMCCNVHFLARLTDL